MAKKSQADKNSEADQEKSGLVAAAEKVGAAAGKVAAMVGVKAPAPRAKKGKLQAKHKQRLPRRQKKAQQKLHRSGTGGQAPMM